MDGIGAGLGAMAFWFFIAAVVVGGIWFDARKRESQQETLRRVVESGQKIDQKVIDRILDASSESKNLHRDLKVAGLIVLFVAPGLAIMGWFMSRVNEEVLPVLTGVSLLVGFVGVGLLVAARYVKTSSGDNQV